MADTLVVIVGRFQVPRLHPGHELLIQWAQGLGDKLMIVIGSANEQGTWRNPLSIDSRLHMLRGWADKIIALNDDPGDDLCWSQQLDALVNFSAVELDCEKIILVCGRDGFKSHYLGQYELRECPIEMQPEWSGTAIRAQIGKDPTHYESEQFRAGVIWAIEQREQKGESDSRY